MSATVNKDWLIFLRMEISENRVLWDWPSKQQDYKGIFSYTRYAHFTSGLYYKHFMIVNDDRK
jgi:hypothetical protein